MNLTITALFNDPHIVDAVIDRILALDWTRSTGNNTDSF